MIKSLLLSLARKNKLLIYRGSIIKVILGACIFVSFYSIVNSQNTHSVKISGQVIDELGDPVAYAAIAIYHITDSTLITGSASDTKGFFSLEVLPGNFFIKVSFLSLKEYNMPNIEVRNADINLGLIKLYPDATLLEEVDIISEKSQVYLQLDKRVFNVGKDLSNTGADALEILDNVPSVTTDVEGNVSLRGSQNVRILIDGKPSGLIGRGGTDALRQLQGNMIEKIEVITNPSAKYDAEGEVGIINIILKKEKQKGINGSFEASAGYPARHAVSFNLNFRKKKTNFFSSYGIRYRQSPGNGYSWQEYDGDTSYVYERYRYHTRGGLSHNFMLGTDMFVNHYNMITISGIYKYSDHNNEALVIYQDYDEYETLLDIVNRLDDENEIQENFEAGISYQESFKEKDRKLTADFKYILSDDTEQSDINQTSNLYTSSLFQKTSNTEDEINLLFQADYVHPFSNKGKFETGTKITLRTINNNYKVEELDSANNWNILQAYNNHFVYHENIYATYMMGSYKFTKISFQGGLRFEYSDIKTQLLATDESNPRSYPGLFPSVHLSYQLDSSNTLQLSYSRRLSRPGFRQLLPFFTFSDNRNFYSGNPDLNPEYTQSFELGYLKYMQKGSILPSAYYRYRTGVMEFITEVDSLGYTKFFPVNLSIQHAFGLEMNGNYDILKNWKVNANFNFYRAITSGSYQGQSLNSDTYTWTARIASKIKLFKIADLQTSCNYRAPYQTTQGSVLASYRIDLGASLSILQKKGTLTFGVRDLLNSNKRRSITIGEGYYSESEFQWRSQQLTLTFNYQIKPGKEQQRYSENIEMEE